MGDYVAIIGIIVSVLLALGTTMMGIIGYLIVSRLNGIEGSVSHIPAMQQEMATLTVKVEQQGKRQEDFAEQMGETSDRLRVLETSHQNTERIAVLERQVLINTEEMNKARPTLHDLQTKVQVVLNNAKFMEMLAMPVPAKG